MRIRAGLLFATMLLATIAAAATPTPAAAAVKVKPVKTGLNGPSAFTFAPSGTIWYLERGTGEVHTLDPASGAVARFEVGARRPAWFASGTADLWIAAADSDVLHVDPATGKVLAHLHVGRTLAQGAAARDGTIWVPDKEQSVVYRIDPVRERVVGSFPAGPGAYLALRAFGSMWVLSYAGADVRRFG